MRAGTLTTLLLAAGLASASAGGHRGHSPFVRRHAHHHHKKGEVLKRGGQCKFPSSNELVAVTPDKENAGWAMAPDMPCKRGMYCPYACKPGKLMAQWDPDAKSYSYPASQNGGLYCNENGDIEKPFPDKPYCMDGVGTVKCQNNAPEPVAFCQTVLPGYEDMLIPTDVVGEATLAVPDTSYWAGTAAHYYINPPGVSTTDGCVWGTKDKPLGNWTPYVAGANQDASGETFVKIGWNPIYLEPATPFRDEVPDYGVRIKCDGGNCNGLPCEIDPTKHKVNEITTPTGSGTIGAGGASFCVVTVPKGSEATIEVFSKNGGSGSFKANSEKEKQVAPPPPPPPPPPPSSKYDAPKSTPTPSLPAVEQDESVDNNEHDPASSKVDSSSSTPASTLIPSSSPGPYRTRTGPMTEYPNNKTVVPPTIVPTGTSTSGAVSLKVPTLALLVTMAAMLL